MNIDKVGEIFLDGRITNIDNASIETLEASLNTLNTKRETIVEKLNKILSEI